MAFRSRPSGGDSGHTGLASTRNENKARTSDAVEYQVPEIIMKLVNMKNRSPKPAKDSTPRIVVKRSQADDVVDCDSEEATKPKKSKSTSSERLPLISNQISRLQPSSQTLKPVVSQAVGQALKSVTPQSSDQTLQLSSSAPKPLSRKPVKASSSSTFQLNLLDDIMCSQASLWKERNKSEEQRADERRQLELERRRKSSENPFEKATNTFINKPQ